MKRLSMLTASLLAAAAFIQGVAVAPTEAQALPPSLQGEVLFASTSNVGQAVSTSCGGTTFTFQASGSASGPYDGTFTESGTFTYNGLGQVTAFQASFTIFDANGSQIVSGTKSFLPGLFSVASCTVAIDDAVSHSTYQATITTGAGSFTDSGNSFTEATRAHPLVLPEDRTLFEFFYLSNGVLPLDTTGKATGGGQLAGGAGASHVSFGFEVKQPQLGQLQGRCNINDNVSGARVKCVDVTSYQQIGNTATWTGNAIVNGVSQSYRITVQDNGEPNQGVDTFSFQSADYSVQGNVAHGNIQLHKQT
jgi:hypothetical protein